MSRQNKVNPDHYTQGGRLSPDDLARERQKQGNGGLRSAGKNRPLPPWLRAQPSAAEPAQPEEPEVDADRPEVSTVDSDADARPVAVRTRPRAAKRSAKRAATKRAAASAPASSRKRATPRAKTAARSARGAKATAASARSANRRGTRKAAAKARPTPRTTRTATTRATSARAGASRTRNAKKR